MMMETQKPESEKDGLRHHFLQIRKALPETERTAMDSLICSLLFQHPFMKQSDTLLAYVSYASETDTHMLIRSALEKGRKVYVPRVLSQKDMQFYKITDMEHLRKSRMGILEPDESCTEPFVITAYRKEPFPVMLLPGLSFDLRGCRLGYGGGYYDRYLENCRTLCGSRSLPLHLLGICYDIQLSARLPEDPLDYPVDTVITENGIFPVRSSFL